MLLTFKCLYVLAPQYLADLIAVAPQSRYNLRSRNATLLVSAKARCLPTLGDRAFQSAAPKLWNSLPVEIRNIQTLTSFKRALKTYFFKRAFLTDLFIHIAFNCYAHMKIFALCMRNISFIFIIIIIIVVYHVLVACYLAKCLAQLLFCT